MRHRTSRRVTGQHASVTAQLIDILAEDRAGDLALARQQLGRRKGRIGAGRCGSRRCVSGTRMRTPLQKKLVR